MAAEALKGMTLTKCYKVSIITICAFELFFGLGAIGVAIPSITAAMHSYYDCYREIYYNSDYNPYDTDCSLLYYTNKFSLTAQGIWTGCFVLISACLSIDFAVNPSRKTGAVSLGFSILANCMTIAMITLEAFPVAEWHWHSHNHNDYEIWIEHCVLISIASLLFILTLTATVLTSTVHCCNKGVKTGCRDDRHEQPATFANDPQYATTVGVPYVLSPAPQNLYVTQPMSVQASPFQQFQHPVVTIQNPQTGQSQPGTSAVYASAQQVGHSTPM